MREANVDIVGRKLVAFAPLKWTRDGELVRIDPGDIFEVDEEDIRVASARADLWLKSGAVAFYEEPKEQPEAEASEARPGGRKGRSGRRDREQPESASEPDSGAADAEVAE